MKRFATGLVVGKFAPLHRGHVHLVEAAAAQCDKVVVVSYTNPEFEPFLPKLRRQWLLDCFPGVECLVLDVEGLVALFPPTSSVPLLPRNEDPDEQHRVFVAQVCVEVVGRRIDAVFTSEAYGDGFAATLEGYFARVGIHGPVVHIAVDAARRSVPISGTALRADLWTNWRFLPDQVARTLVRRVVLLGAESTGKSTLASRLASEWDTSFVAEYGRERWHECRGVLNLNDMAEIANEQLRREEEATLRARRFLFCDTSPLTTLFYSQALFGVASEALKTAARQPYDLTILCAPDIPFEQDGTRQSMEFRMRQQEWYRAELIARGIPYLLAEGSLGDRIVLVGDRLRHLA